MYEVACKYSFSKHAFAELLVKPYKLLPSISQKTELSTFGAYYDKLSNVCFEL